MREILGRRRGLRFRRSGRHAQLDAALTCATGWQWPVVPGVGHTAPGGRERGCACPDPECVVPGAHPFDPGLLAATTDARMVRWWWTNRPDAPVIIATGGRAPCALSLPAAAGARALVALDQLGMRLGPVVATPTRWSLLVAPYSLERLGALLHAKEWVPSSLRFHGEGGYLVLPPSETGKGPVWWERAPSPVPQLPPRLSSWGLGRTLTGRAPARTAEPIPGSAAPWLPDVGAVVDALVEASTGAPGGGSRLAY